MTLTTAPFRRTVSGLVTVAVTVGGSLVAGLVAPAAAATDLTSLQGYLQTCTGAPPGGFRLDTHLSATSAELVVKCEATIDLAGINLAVRNIVIEPGQSLEVTDTSVSGTKGTLTADAFYADRPAIQNTGATLIISGRAAVWAKSGALAAGIGGTGYAAGGTTRISDSATVTALGGDGGAGIGGGHSRAGGTTTITGTPTVTATGGKMAAGIGGGFSSQQGGTTTIAGGDVTAIPDQRVNINSFTANPVGTGSIPGEGTGTVRVTGGVLRMPRGVQYVRPGDVFEVGPNGTVTGGASLDGYYAPGWQFKVGTVVNEGRITLPIDSDKVPISGHNYHVAFDANGGTTAPASVRVHAPSFALGARPFPAAVPSRPDHTFTGWNTARDGSGTPLAAGSLLAGTSTGTAHGITAYAQWTEHDEPTKLADRMTCAHGTGTIADPSTYRLTSDLTAPATTLSVTCHSRIDLAGHTLRLDSLTVRPGTSLDIVDTAGTSGTGVLATTRPLTLTDAALTVTAGELRLLDGTQRIDARDTFAIGAHGVLDGGASVAGTGTLTNHGAITLPADQVQVKVTSNHYRLDFDTTGGSTPPPAVTAYAATLGAAGATLPADPTRPDHTFAGWNTRPDGTGDRLTATTALPGTSTDGGPVPITAYAQWTEHDEPTKLADRMTCAHGTGTIADPSTYRLTSDLTAPATTLSVTCHSRIDLAGHTLRLDSLTVRPGTSLDIVDTAGTSGTGVLATTRPLTLTDAALTVTAGELRLLDGNQQLGPRDILTIATDGVLAGHATVTGTGTLTNHGAITLPADHVQVKVEGHHYRLDFDTTGGSTPPPAVTAYAATLGAAGATLPADPTRPDHTFAGWNTRPDGTGDRLTATTALPGTSTDGGPVPITAYAQWTKDPVPAPQPGPAPAPGADPAPAAAPLAPAPAVVLGTPRTGSLLSARIPGSDLPGATTTFQWQSRTVQATNARGSARGVTYGPWRDIPGATGQTYTPGPRDVGTQVRVEALVQAPGQEPQAHVVVVGLLKAAVLPRPATRLTLTGGKRATIRGLARYLRALPRSAAVRYTWHVGHRTLRTHRKTLRITPGLRGARIRATVIVTAPGHTPRRIVVRRGR